MDPLIEEARQRALETLGRAASARGFKASALARGYPHIWSRDTGIIALGAAASGDAQSLAAFRTSLDTLGAHQSTLGLVPLNVEADTGIISTENAGATDSNLWFILAHYMHFLATRDTDYLRLNWPAIERALLWLRYQDMNECGLLEVPEAGDWMDLLAVRYNVLYDNVLWYAVLRAFVRMAGTLGIAPGGHTDPPRMGELAAGVHERLNLLMWIDRCWEPMHFAERLAKLKQMRLEWYMLYHNVGTISSRPYYLPYVAFREYGDYCDVLGNLLAILCGVADEERGERILRYLYQVGAARPYPTKAIYPPIYPGQSDWREYYRSRNLNLPHQYHNGGIWPMIGGFHVAALVKQGWHAEAASLLHDLAAACRLGVSAPWEFNEWMHGESGNPMGYALQSWSAGMYLYAHDCVSNGRTLLFDALCP